MPLFRTLSPRHRRFLAGMVVLTVTAAVFLLDAFERQRQFKSRINAVNRAGGRVSLASPLWRQNLSSWRNYAVTRETWVELDGESFDDEWLSEHDNLAPLRFNWLSVDECPITASGFEDLISNQPIDALFIDRMTNCDSMAAALTLNESLRIACFRRADLSDAGFRNLPLESLEVVNVSGTNVTPVGLLELRRCRQLYDIELDGRQFDDDVAELLRIQPQFTMLFLNGKDVADRHLRRIHGMTVTYVCLTDTSVTSEGVAAIRQSLPHCHISVHSTAERIEP